MNIGSELPIVNAQPSKPSAEKSLPKSLLKTGGKQLEADVQELTGGKESEGKDLEASFDELFDAASFKPVARSAGDRVKPKVKTEAATDLTSALDGMLSELNKLNISPAKAGFADEQADIKEKAIIDFMERLQSEFGISPDKVIKALAQLSPEQRAAPPESVAQNFVQNLGVKGDTQTKIKKLYKELVKVTGEADLNQKMAGDRDLLMQIMTPKEMRIEKLQKSLGEMNKSFFSQPVSKDGKVQIDNTASSKNNNQEVAVANAKATAQTTGDVNRGGPNFLASVAAGTAGATAVATTNAAKPNGLPNSSVIDSADIDVESLEVREASSQASAAPSDTMSTLDFVKQSEAPIRSFSSADKLQNYKKIDKKLVATEVNGESKGEAKADPNMINTNGQSVTAEKPLAAAGASSMFSVNAQPNMEQRISNAQEIVNKAQALTQKGGGEVSVQLQPDGLGKVRLKVNVQDGQVQVKMFAENDGAKKALEKGIEDLKSNLASQKLHVESVKVEMAGEAGRGRLEQNLNDAQREQTRQMASDFMGQFRDDRQAFREGFNMAGGFRRFDQDRQSSVEVKPDAVDVNASSLASRRSRANSRLDLVA